MQIAGFIWPSFEVILSEMYILFILLTALKNYILKDFIATALSRINVPITLDNPQNTLSTVFIGTGPSVESSCNGNIYSKVFKKIDLL